MRQADPQRRTPTTTGGTTDGRYTQPEGGVMADLEWTTDSDPEAGTAKPLPYIVDIVGETGGNWFRGFGGFAWSPGTDGIWQAEVANGTLAKYTATQEWFDEMTDTTGGVRNNPHEKWCPVPILLGKP